MNRLDQLEITDSGIEPREKFKYWFTISLVDEEETEGESLCCQLISDLVFNYGLFESGKWFCSGLNQYDEIELFLRDKKDALHFKLNF